MKTKLKHAVIPPAALFLLLSTFNVQLSTCYAQGTAFTYQGRLNVGGTPANGTYDLVFTVYDLPTGSGAFANQTNSAIAISNGLFTATLDFGPGIFTGPERWLELAVRTNGSGSFTTNSPRQKITATPYAITAGNVSGSVSASQLAGLIAPANIGAGTITSSMLAAGSVTTSNLANGAVTLSKLSTTSTWAAATFFPNPAPAIGDTFGVALAAVGTDKVVISANWDDPGVVGAGAVYVFNTNGTLLTSISNPTPAEIDLFGNAVDAVGVDKVIVGAFLKDIGATNAGAAYLFSTSGALLTTFTNPTPALDDEFGNSVAGFGTDRVLISAPLDSTAATNAGAAYLYNVNGTLLTTFTNPTPVANDQFGFRVAAVGDKVLISALAADLGGPDAGAVYLFTTNGALLTTFTNPNPAQLFVFGAFIAPAGNDKVLISGPNRDTTNGVVFLYGTNGTLLATFGPAVGLGASLAWISPDKVAIGAPGAMGGVGAVYVSAQTERSWPRCWIPIPRAAVTSVMQWLLPATSCSLGCQAITLAPPAPARLISLARGHNMFLG